MAIVDIRGRHTYGEQDPLIGEIEMVGWTAPKTAHTYGLGPHRHVGWEICWLRRGQVDWWAGDQVFAVKAGDCYVTQPGVEHGGVHARLTPCDLFWVQVRPSRACAWQDIQARMAQDIQAALRALPQVFPGSDGLEGMFAEILGEHRRRDEHSVTLVRATLHRLLIEVIRCGRRHVEQRSAPSTAILRAQAQAMAHLHEGIGVEALARQAGLSPSRFHARFLEEVGESPADWLRRRRIDQAKRLLVTSSRPVTALALDLGFPSSQYFATVFRRYVGLSPREYRADAQHAST